MIVLSIVSFLLITGFIALFSALKTRTKKVQTTNGLFFADHNNNFFIVGGALLLSNISANQFIGENESIYTNNMSVMAWGVSSVLAMLLVAEFFLPIYFRTGAMTIPDYLGKRYDNSTKRLVSIVFLCSYVVNLLPAVLYGGAVALTGMFNFLYPLELTYWQNIWIMVWVIGLTGCAYSVLGGLRAISISDTILSVGLLTIGIAFPYFGFKFLGNGDWSKGFHILLSEHTEHLNAIGGPHDEIPLSTIFTGMFIMNLYYWGMEQFIVQQALSAKSLSHSQKGMGLACLGKLLCPFIINIPGLVGVHLYKNLENTAEVFPLVVKDTLPGIMIGLTAAVVLGAAISTFNAGLNSSSTLFVLNLYKPWLEKRNKEITEKHLVYTGRKFEIIVSALAMFSAPFIMFSKAGFYTYLQQLGGMFCVPIFTIILVGFVSKKVPPQAAKIGMVFFIFSYIIFNYILDIKLHYLHMLALLFVFTTICMLVVARFYPKYKYTEIKIESVELSPWKNRYWYFALLLTGMVSIFVLFSKWGIA
ncbi:solute:sodium symporter family transporter [Flavobacterium aquidurense]|uniref:solute:sodium symporter family transporter n=1 Tax=Flavobacterium aquidurense TaxID=362413 RepID=UPI0009117BC2|nr:solute:sodium symporter family transporter [Flavobacterium aquidurense]OXA70777.1 solute:sodium symporter family transporter [Flavobacterium aquidurense]SHG00197.1 solute:Na+ symporter, SSS family [Flavobacterium frigidimaris]